MNITTPHRSEARALRVHPDDDVATLISPVLASGVTVRAGSASVVTRGAVPSGHKVALRAVAQGSPVRKFGVPFGQAKVDIAPGDWVHTHNVGTLLRENDSYRWAERDALVPGSTFRVSETQTETVPTFRGYVRADGRVGIRNELWVLCTVGCVNRVAERIAMEARRLLAKEYGGPVDGVYAHTHPYGCAQIGTDLSMTRDALSALAAHPNCGGVLLLGLGCENNILQEQVASLRNADLSRVRYFSAQDADDEIEEAVRLLTELAQRCATDTREEVSASRLVLGMKCGGSDGFSGLTANPLVGVLSDRIAGWGGTSLLTEVPEMFGAERLLMARAPNSQTFDKVAGMINGFKDYFRRYNEPISENPSPGNKAGGITTLEEKSLGCVQKGGTIAPVTQVLDYGEVLAVNGVEAQGKRQKAKVGEGEGSSDAFDTAITDAPQPSAPFASCLVPLASSGGIALVYGPGNDAVSCTALSIAGAQMVLFTTGRGTPFGTCVPTLKISTNSDLARRKPHWIDFDAGAIVDEGTDVEHLADDLMALVLRIASGEQLTRSEINGYREIAIFKDGVTL